MAAYEWRPATAEDIPFLAEHIRQSDIDELEAAAGIGPREALAYALTHSTHAWTGLLNGVPCCLFGVADCVWSRSYGAAWMIGTDQIERHPAAFLRGSRKAIAEMLTLHPRLCNYVDARHAKAIQWLSWLGAKLGPAQPYGVAGLPFHFFVIGG